MHKAMVIEKKEGATMTCPICGSVLTCRMSNYKLPYSNKLQWQNQDGSAHFVFDSGKFTCTGIKESLRNLRNAIKEQDEMMQESELSKGSSKPE